MGMTPLEGLLMGTRSGDIDPAIIDYLAIKEGLTIPQIESLLNKQSGLIGISGLTNDMRELIEEAHENNDRRARLAIAGSTITTVRPSSRLESRRFAFPFDG